MERDRDTRLIAHDLRDTSAPDRNLALELVRVTESAALAAGLFVVLKEPPDAAVLEAPPGAEPGRPARERAAI